MKTKKDRKMAAKIVYEDRSEWNTTPTFRTQKFGNLLSDTYQGEVHQNGDGTWTGWLMNLGRQDESQFRFGFKSKGAATRWVNDLLREIIQG